MFCNCCRKKSKKPENKRKPANKQTKTLEEYGDDSVMVESVHRYDEKILNILEKDLTETPEWFVLNNMLMSIQFFENYQKDVFKTAHTSANKMEKELNRTLLEKETMECTSPDVVFDIVNKNVHFRRLHGTRKHMSETLAVKRMFVINDMIEVMHTMEVAQYTSIDKPAYQVRVEESPKKGYVRLKFIDSNKIPRIYETPPNLESNPGSSKDSDSEIYDYMSITELRTPKPLEIIQNPRRDTLPRSCFASRRVRRNLTDFFMENEDQEVDLSEEDLFETITYVNAKGFMNYFKNGIFPNSLGKSLGFDDFEITNRAKDIPGKVFCNLYDTDDNPIPCEVIPGVSIEFPAEQTFDFVMREERPTIIDYRTGMRFRWPTDEMIKEIKALNCVLVPTGYWPKKGRDVNAEIEWEIAFPKVERYIESRMSHTQMRCFLFILAIHKTFIEPETKQHGLLTEHIRCLMYWECERDYRDWPEHRLGFKLRKVIVNLLLCLTKKRLLDYFIKPKNHFENIANKYLIYAQQIFQKVLEAPLMYFLTALRNLRYTSGKFYPPLDFKELQRILIQTQGLKIVNPSLLKTIPPNFKQQRYMDEENNWNYLNVQKNKAKFIKKRQQEKEKENLNREDERRESTDSINLEWVCEKRFDIYKIKALLQLFINQFIDLAKDSSRLSTKEQALFYLKQAWYLTKLLERTSPSFIVEANEFRDIISEEEIKVKKEVAKEMSDTPPLTPMRNNSFFEYPGNQQIRNKVVSAPNHHSSYKSGNIQRTTSVVVHRQSPTVKTKRAGEPGNQNFRKSISFVEPRKNY